MPLGLSGTRCFIRCHTRSYLHGLRRRPDLTTATRSSANTTLTSPRSGAGTCRTVRRYSEAAGWEAEEEPLKDYARDANGYLPVAIGDILGSHYRIIRKIGWGGYSTVWITQDIRRGQAGGHRYSALKIMTRVATEAQERLQELAFMRCMQERSPQHPGHQHIIQLREDFYQRGPHGRHLCLVMEPLLQDLRSLSLRFPDRLTPPHLARLLSRQIVLGVQYLHEECNIIHTDLKLSNIMLVPPGDPETFLAMTLPRLEATNGTCTRTGPDGSPIPRVPSRPLPYPLPDHFDMFSFDAWGGVSVKIGDVGVACWADRAEQHFTDLIQAPSFRAPEVAIGAPWGKPADVWSIGCMLYELYMGEALFGTKLDDALVPTAHTQILGNEYPRELMTRGKRRELFFNDDGSLKQPPQRRFPLYNAICERDAPDAALFADFLRHIFVYDPDRRATCRDLLKHPWLNP
ncbi:kinase-like domain-containing protein [Trametes polyzona]|nr:kinase-like domain-containing protein [Trametes polyzona]